MKMVAEFDKEEKNNFLDNSNGIELKKCVKSGSTLVLEPLDKKEENGHSKVVNELVGNDEPNDRYNFVYWIFIIHGIGTLMPWNMFMTAKSYYTDYKLNINTLDSVQDELLNDFRNRFLSIAGVSSQIPNLVFNGLNLLLAYYASGIGGNLTTRIVGSIIINFIVMLFTLAMVVVDSSTWPLRFFYLTIGSIVLLNMSNGFYQNSIYGVAAQLPMRFTNAVILGNNVCGTLVSLVAIASIAISPDPRLAAFYYFLSALLILFVCLISYFLLPLSTFYRFYTKRNHHHRHQSIDKSINCQDTSSCEQLQKLNTSNGLLIEKPTIKTNNSGDEKKEQEANNGNGDSKVMIKSVRPAYGLVFRQVALQCFNVFVTFVITLLLFPTILSDVRPTTSTSSSFVRLPLPSVYFTPVACYLGFNLTAMLGNLLPSLFMWPSSKYLHWAVLSRLILIPFFLFCNYKNHLYPVWFDNDYVFVIGVLIMGLSHGHLSSLAMMYASKSAPENAAIAGMLSAFWLVFGIFVGISLSFVF